MTTTSYCTKKQEQKASRSPFLFLSYNRNCLAPAFHNDLLASVIPNLRTVQAQRIVAGFSPFLIRVKIIVCPASFIGVCHHFDRFLLVYLVQARDPLYFFRHITINKQHYDMGNSKKGSCFPNGTQLLASGFSLAGLRSFQAMKIVDFMKQQNAETISVFGISGGGMGAIYLSACDSRIDHMILSGYPCTWPDTLFVHHHCIDNFVPGMTRIADGPQIISLFAPKPLLLLTGKADHVFALSGAQKAFSVVREAYQIFDCPHQLQSFVFDGGHEAAPELVIPWFRDQCK